MSELNAEHHIEMELNLDEMYLTGEWEGNDGEPFEEKMTRMTSELSGLFAKCHELEDEIGKKLGAIGYEV